MTKEMISGHVYDFFLQTPVYCVMVATTRQENTNNVGLLATADEGEPLVEPEPEPDPPPIVAAVALVVVVVVVVVPPLAEPTNNKRFGEPVPASLILSAVAALRMAVFVCALEKSGLAWRISAPAPAT